MCSPALALDISSHKISRALAKVRKIDHPVWYKKNIVLYYYSLEKVKKNTDFPQEKRVRRTMFLKKTPVEEKTRSLFKQSLLRNRQMHIIPPDTFISTFSFQLISRSYFSIFFGLSVAII